MRLRFAMVCASNQNRSMEAHKLLQEAGFTVSSYGVGRHVKLPGKSAAEPNVYPFGTPYRAIHDDLRQKDPAYYARNGLLKMLERNMQLKPHPERWQDCALRFDVALTFEESVMEQLTGEMAAREQASMQPLLVVNIDVKDSHAEAARMGPQALLLCQMLEESEDWEDDLDGIMDRFEARTGRRPHYSVCFY